LQLETTFPALGAANALDYSAGFPALGNSSSQRETQNAKPETASPARWLKLADYGDWPHPAGLQRLTPDAAARMAHGFKSLLGRLRRRFSGIPIYIGHPDDPSFAGQPGHDDTRAYAWVSNLEARPDGLHLLARWSEPGHDLLKHAFYKFLSPRWQMRPLSPGVYEPVRLLSIGLTNHPNIPGESVANQSPPVGPALAPGHSPAPAPSPAEFTTLNSPTTAATLATSPSASATSPDSPTPLPASSPQLETQNSKLETLLPHLPRLLSVLEFDPAAPPETLLANAENLAAAARESRDAQLEAARFYRLCTDAESALQAANVRATAERSARVDLVLDLAELRGQLPPAERAAWRLRLSSDFEPTLVALSNYLPPARPTLPAASLTVHLSARRPGAATPFSRDRLLALVNERMAKTGEDYPTAWSRVKRQHAGLFLPSL
jgi:hypothetical protein